MKRWLSSLFSLLVALFVPALCFAVSAEEHGGGHGEHGIDAKTFALQLFNFGVLLFILIKYGGGAISKALRSRHDQLKTDLAESQRLRAEAETRLQEQEKRLGNLETEMSDLRKRMKQESEAEKARLIAAAEEKARRVQTETSFLLDQQVKQAELNFRAEVALAAARIAEELVRNQVGPADQQRLVETFVGEVQETKQDVKPGQVS